MKKLLICTLLTAMTCTTMMAKSEPSILSIKDTITDNHIIYPESFDADIKGLQTNWYLQRYAVIDSMAKHPVVANVSDQEYISRLQGLPTVIEMPYNSIVRQYIEMYANRRHELVERMLSLGLYYNPIFEDALERYGLPMELKYLPIIESALNPNAVSRAGAAGLWQFMPSTATGEGLEVNSLIDERRDPYRSSEAAASLLKKYYDIFGDWHLTLAAYNCGPGNVNKAIKNSGGKRDFWEIYNYLPKETRGYVPAFIAATYIMNNFGHHGISPAVARSPIVTDTVHVDKRVHFNQISAVMGMPIDELRILNPQYRQDIIPGNIRPYTLILPSVQAYCYKVSEDSILMYNRDKYEQRAVVEPSTGRSQSMSEIDAQQAAVQTGSDNKGAYVDEVTVKYHTVKRGETLASIAKIYGVTPESIREANDLSSTKVKRGKKLKINIYNRVYTNDVAATSQQVTTTDSTATVQPVAAAPVAVNTTVAPAQQQSAPKANNTKTNTQKQQAKPKTYVVKSGDSLDRIASRNGVTVAELKKANNLKSDVIHPGQKLSVPAKNSGTKSSTKKSTSKKSSKKRRR